MVYLILSIILFLLLILSSFYCYKFAKIIINIQDNLQYSLDLLDSKHQTISEILQRPLFFDSPEIRRVLAELIEAKKAIHEIAYTLSAEFIIEDQEQEEQQ